MIIDFYKKSVVNEKALDFEREIELAYESVQKEFIEAIDVASGNIKLFHEKQRPRDM